MRFHIIRNARIENVGKSQSCMVSKLRIIWKQTVVCDDVAPVTPVRAAAADLSEFATAAPVHADFLHGCAVRVAAPVAIVQLNAALVSISHPAAQANVPVQLIGHL